MRLVDDDQPEACAPFCELPERPEREGLHRRDDQPGTLRPEALGDRRGRDAERLGALSPLPKQVASVNQDERRRQADRAYEIVVDKYNIENVVYLWIEAIEKIVKSNSKSRLNSV